MICGDGNNVVYGRSFNGDAADEADQTRMEGDGANVVYSNGGDDLVVIAGRGPNTGFRGFGNDTIVVGSGADSIVGGARENVMSGGNGADRFVVNAGEVNFIIDFILRQGDRIETGGQSYTESQTAEGYAGISHGNGSLIVLQCVLANIVTGDFFA